MTGPDAAIACFGAAHIDRHARAVGPVVLGSSNPVALSRSPGGVARNVAESLARLGCRVALVSRVGADSDGDGLVAAMTALGVDMGATLRSPARATGGYTALLDPDGGLTVGMADMAIYEELTPEVLAQGLHRIGDRALWFADCNLPQKSLAYLRLNKPPGTWLAVDTVSVAKSERLRGVLDGVDLLFCNRDEAASLAGQAQDPDRLAMALRDRGAAAVIVSLGPDGAVLAETSRCTALPAFDAEVRDVTGAGDGLVAGVLFGLAQQRPLADCLRIGLAAAAQSLEGERAVADGMTAEALLARAGLPAWTGS